MSFLFMKFTIKVIFHDSDITFIITTFIFMILTVFII